MKNIQDHEMPNNFIYRYNIREEDVPDNGDYKSTNKVDDIYNPSIKYYNDTSFYYQPNYSCNENQNINKDDLYMLRNNDYGYVDYSHDNNIYDGRFDTDVFDRYEIREDKARIFVDSDSVLEDNYEYKHRDDFWYTHDNLDSRNMIGGFSKPQSEYSQMLTNTKHEFSKKSEIRKSIYEKSKFLDETLKENIRNNILDNCETDNMNKRDIVCRKKKNYKMKRERINQDLDGISETSDVENSNDAIEEKVYKNDEILNSMNMRDDYINNYKSNYSDPRNNEEQFQKQDIEESYIPQNIPFDGRNYNTENAYNVYKHNPSHNIATNNYSSYRNNDSNLEYQFHQNYNQEAPIAMKDNEPLYINPQQYYETDYNNNYGFDNMNDQPLYVNVKQYGHIRKRKIRRDYLDSLMQNQANSGYLHESRHKHAMNRMRASSGRFLTKEETAAMKAKEKLENEKSSEPESFL